MLGRAFLIGCSEYDDPDIASLKHSGADVSRFASVVRNVCGIADAEVVELAHGQRAPTRNNIIRAIAQARNRPGPSTLDLLVFFFSGHGFHSQRDDKEYLVPTDAVYNDLEGTSLKFQDVVTYLLGWGARTVVLFLDACRATPEGGRDVAGEWQKFDVGSLETRHGMAIFSSCSPGQRSYESDALSSGIFTHGLCEALSDVGRCASIYELDQFLLTRVPALSRQQSLPVQVPYTRVEPLSTQQVVIISDRKAAAWRSEGLVGTEIRRAPRVEYMGAIGEGVPICGIDFGTSYSGVSFIRGNETVLIPSPQKKFLVPSVIHFDERLDYVVGFDAVERARYDPEHAVFHVKRYLGTSTAYNLYGRTLSPELVASCIIRSLSRNAQDYLGIADPKSVVGVPANFNVKQRSALARACALAGLNVARMLPEPSVASFVLHDESRNASTGTQSEIVAIIDLGGGTFDVSIVDFGDDVSEVIAIAGDVQLGGVDYDEAISACALDLFRGRIGDGSYQFTPLDRFQIRSEAERAKVALGSKDETTLLLRDIEVGPNGLENVEVTLTRGQFRVLTANLNSRIEACIRRAIGAMETGYHRGSKLTKVLLAGQGSKIFTVRETIEKVCGAIPIIREFQETAVVLGLGRQGGILSGALTGLLLLDVFPQGLGLRCVSSKPLAVGNFERDPSAEIRVSKVPTENREIHHLVAPDTTIPTMKRCRIVPTSQHALALSLDLVEISNLDQSTVSIGSMPVQIPAEGKEQWVDLTATIDANSIVNIEILDPEGRSLKRFKLDKEAFKET